MNKQAPEYERLKEKIAIFLVARDDEISLEDAEAMWNKWKIVSTERGHSGDCTNEPETCSKCLVSKVYEDVDTILSIKGIAILADEQSLPELPEFYDDWGGESGEVGYVGGRKDMLKAHFKKVV